MSKIIYIDAGHGGTDSGAVSGSFVEKTLNLKVANACKNYLTKYDCTVIQNRTSDATNTVIADMAKEAKDKGACAYISIHHNAGGGDGCEVYCQTNNDISLKLGSEILSQFYAIGQNAHGETPKKNGDDYKVCKFCANYGIPALIGEFAYVDNAIDRKIIDSDVKLIKEGEAYAKAIAKVLNLTTNNGTLYRVQVGAYSKKSNADTIYNKLASAGYRPFITMVDNLYKVQVGAFSVKSNADKLVNELKAKGFDAIITTSSGVAVSTSAQQNTTGGFKIGDKVHIITGSTDVNTKTKYASFVYENIYEVIAVDNKYLTFGLNGAITGKTYLSNCRLK